jgi:hypothetical protein
MMKLQWMYVGSFVVHALPLNLINLMSLNPMLFFVQGVNLKEQLIKYKIKVVVVSGVDYFRNMN